MDESVAIGGDGTAALAPTKADMSTFARACDPRRRLLGVDTGGDFVDDLVEVVGISVARSMRPITCLQ